MSLRQRLELDSQSYIQDLRRAEAGMERFARRTKTAAADAGQRFADSAGQAERSWSSSTGRIRDMIVRLGGVVAAVFSARAIAGFVRGMVEANSAVQQLQVSFSSLTGSSAEAARLLDEIRERGSEIPLAFEDAAASVKQLLAFGFDGDEVMGVFDTLMDAGASQGIKGLPQRMEQIARALGQIKANGKVNLEELNQLSEAGLPARQILADALGLSGGELADQISEGLVSATAGIPALLQGMEEAFEGSGERAANTFDGKMVRVKDTLRDIQRQAGERIFLDLEADLGGANQALEEFADSQAFRDGVDLLTSSITGLVRVLRVAVPVFVDVAPALAWGGVAYASATALGALGSGLKKTGAFFGLLRDAAREGRDEALGFTRALHKVIDVSKDQPTARVDPRASVTRGGPPLDPFGGLNASRLAEMNREYEDYLLGMARHRREMRAAGQEGTRFQQSVARVQTRLVGFGGAVGGVTRKVGSLVGGLARGVVAAFGWPAVLAAVGAAAYAVADKFNLFSREVAQTTEKIREQIEAARALATELDNLKGSALGATLFAAEQTADALRAQTRAAFDKLPDDLQAAIRRAAAGGYLKDLGDELQAEAQRGVLARPGSRLGPAAVRAGVVEPVVVPGGRAGNVMAGDWSRETIQAAADYVASTAALGQALRNLRTASAKTAGDLAAQLGRARAELDALLDRDVNRGDYPTEQAWTRALEQKQRRVAELDALIESLEKEQADQSGRVREAPVPPSTVEPVGDPGPDPEDEARRLRDTLDGIRDDAFVGSHAEGLRALAQDLVDVNGQLAALAAVEGDLVEQFGDEAATAVAARREQLEAEQARIADLLARFRDVEFAPVEARGPVDGADPLDPESHMAAAAAATRRYQETMTDLELKLEAGAISQDAFNEAAEEAGEATRDVLTRYLDQMERLGLLTPELKDRLLDLFKSVDGASEEVKGTWETLADALRDVVEVGDNLTRTLDAAAGALGDVPLKKTLGVLADVVAGYTDVTASMERYATARQALADGSGTKLGVLGAGLGAAAAGAGFVAAMYQWQASEQAERRAANRAFADATRDFHRAVEDFAASGRVGADLTAADADVIRTAAAMGVENEEGYYRLVGDDMRNMDYGLATNAAGHRYTLQDLEDSLKTVFGDGFDLADAWKTFVDGGGRAWTAFMDSLGIDEIGASLSGHGGFSDTVAGAVAGLEHFTRYVTDDATAALAKFTGDLLDGASADAFGPRGPGAHRRGRGPRPHDAGRPGPAPRGRGGPRRHGPGGLPRPHPRGVGRRPRLAPRARVRGLRAGREPGGRRGPEHHRGPGEPAPRVPTGAPPRRPRPARRAPRGGPRRRRDGPDEHHDRHRHGLGRRRLRRRRHGPHVPRPRRARPPDGRRGPPQGGRREDA